MGKSAKFYKRPSKKEKEGLAVKKLVEPSAISKNKRNGNTMTVIKDKSAPANNKRDITVSASMFEKKTPKKTSEDVDMMEEDKPVATESKKEKVTEAELPDYVDLFSGKKTYKKIPKKRK